MHLQIADHGESRNFRRVDHPCLQLLDSRMAACDCCHNLFARVWIRTRWQVLADQERYLGLKAAKTVAGFRKNAGVVPDPG